MEKSYIWTLPTRVFHFLFAFFILFAFLSDEDEYLNYHAIIGYLLLILLIFRLFWGFWGPKYSLFKDFPISIKSVKEFSFHIFKTNQKYLGHNPLASYIMIAILMVTFLSILSGILVFGIQEGKGILSFLNSTYYKNMHLFKEIHEVLANTLLALIFVHLSGVIIDKILHKQHKTLNSIFTGYKITQEKETIYLNSLQKSFTFFMLIIFIGFLLLNLFKQNNIFVTSKFLPIDYKAQNKAFVNECGSCHMLYPPNFLPKKSWELLMSNLKNHFGDDASVDENTNRNILAFLLKNSAENSTYKVSWNFLNSINNQDIIALSNTSYWKKKHRKIAKEVFESSKVKSKANCKVCHNDIEKGLIEYENIKNPLN